VSLNLAEEGSIELGTALIGRGIGIEAGVFGLADADALLAAPWTGQVTRVLVEVIFEHDDVSAVELATVIDRLVAALRVERSQSRAQRREVVDELTLTGDQRL